MMRLFLTMIAIAFACFLPEAGDGPAQPQIPGQTHYAFSELPAA
jgi:hypothetical protein